MTANLVRIVCITVALAACPALTASSRESDRASRVMEYLEEGSRYYLQHDFRSAIGPYAKALQLEKASPTLDRTLWRVLVDNLGMAYGISGDLEKAKETFEYGLSKDATYPLFFYNLACTYAEMNDMESAIVNLQLAFKHEANLIEGERMPDPAADDSFQRFMKNEKFLAALSAIESAK